jgi:hypothetical protein
VQELLSPEQAEGEAWLEGLRLTLEWIQQLTWVETDCSKLVNDIRKIKPRKSPIPGSEKHLPSVQFSTYSTRFEHDSLCYSSRDA